MAALEPAQFQACLLCWVRSLVGATDGKLVAIDGKTVRRGLEAKRERAAWDHEYVLRVLEAAATIPV